MIGNRMAALVAAALATVAAPSALVGQADSLARLRWLAGCWELNRGNLVTTEMWMAPAGGLMLGASRTVAGPALREWEQLRLAAGARLVYTASPWGRQPTDFTAVSVTDSGFTVENPAHDFPQRIIYRRRGADSLVARIEGNTPGGSRGSDYPMRRVRCEAS